MVGVNMVYDLLVIFTNGEYKTVNSVSKYGINNEIGCAYYDKNGYKSFFPLNQIMFIGRAFDYNNCKIADSYKYEGENK